MNEETDNYFLKNLKGVMDVLFRITFALARIAVLIFLLIGATASIILLIKSYPKMLITLLPFFNFLDMILEIMIFFFKLSIWLVLSYFLIKGMFFYRYIFIKLKEKRIERRTKKRKEFIKELAKEIKSKKK